MLIHEMNYDECVSVLARLKFGRLACVRDNQPYIVPIYFVLHERHLYTFSTSGQKIEWMRGNPRVCVEADEITSSYQWLSVVVFGRYEELPDTPEYTLERNLAHDMLAERAMWWQPAYVASTHHSTADSLTLIYYRIHMDHVTGHRGLPDPVEAATLSTSEPTIKRESRLVNLLRRVRLI
jgi:nitroimidazol reductase NimA-like FMN-containing flavoprotein (pyridoxamine 5'-phosphate oxidase superfamily)